MGTARRKRLNVPLIKSVVMFVLGAITGAGSALTGIGAQVAAAPMAAFLLGYSRDKAAGTGLVFSLFVAAMAAVGASHAGVTFSMVEVLLLAAGAVIGALVSSPWSARQDLTRARRLAQSISMLLITVYVLGAALHPRFGGFAPPLPFLTTAWGWLVVGVACGALSGVFHIANGVLLVPAQMYLLGSDPMDAVAVSLSVIALASILPALSYVARGLVDTAQGPPMALGGALGGLAGGLALPHVGPAVVLIAFALVALYLAAWMLWKLT